MYRFLSKNLAYVRKKKYLCTIFEKTMNKKVYYIPVTEVMRINSQQLMGLADGSGNDKSSYAPKRKTDVF